MDIFESQLQLYAESMQAVQVPEKNKQKSNQLLGTDHF